MKRHPEVRRAIKRSGIKRAAISDLRSRVIKKTLELAEPLPDSMLYKTQKPQHALDAERDARALAPRLGMNPLETEVLALLLASHDIGRLVEAQRQADGLPRADVHHGVLSADQIRLLLGEEMSSTHLGTCLLAAITHHADAKPVTMADVGDDTAAWALATLVRDIDKAENFEQTYSYLEDASYKESLRHHDWPEQIKTDPEWGREMGRIDPPEMLDVFERHQLLQRRQCRSYEAYMLQFLAWTFDIVHPEILKRTLASGGPIVVRDYIDRRLADEPEQRIRFRTALRNWRRGLMAIA